MKNLQINYILQFMSPLSQHSPLESQLMVALPSGTSFFGIRLMVGIGGLSMEIAVLHLKTITFTTV